jgi:hypothetical protein
MILKAKERGGGQQLARYLLAMRDNDHVELHEVRGFASESLHGAFSEADAIALGTRCEKHLFSMSLNPPEGAEASVEVFEQAIDEVERKLGLETSPALSSSMRRTGDGTPTPYGPGSTRSGCARSTCPTTSLSFGTCPESCTWNTAGTCRAAFRTRACATR